MAFNLKKTPLAFSPLDMLKKKKKVEEPVVTPIPPKIVVPQEPIKTEQQMKDEGNLYIQQREKAKSLGTNKEEANQIAIQRTAGVNPTQRTVAEAQANQNALRNVAEKVGQIPQQQPQNIPTDFESATKAGVGTLGIGAASGLVAGLAAAPFTAGVSIPVGVAAGAGVDFIRGFTGKLKRDSNENIAAEFTTLADSKRSIRAIITQVNSKDPSMPMDVAVELFNEQLAAIDMANRQINKESKKDLNKFLGVDAQVQLRKMINFNSPGGLRELYIIQMQNAIMNPDSSRPLPFDEADLEAMGIE